MGSVIRAIRSHLPARVLTNQELAPQLGWSAEQILAKTGIAQRHVSGPDECVSDLAVSAAARLLSEMQVAPTSIDFLILCTQTPDHILPATACLVQQRLGLSTHCMAFDLNQGCSGYVYALGTAHGLLAAGLGRRGLIITADTYTKYIHPLDRSVRTLFGDGAAATLVEAMAESNLGHFVFGTDGQGAANLMVPAGGARRRASAETAVARVDANGNTRAPDNLYMNGQEIFAFTLRRVPELVARVLEDAHLTLADIDGFVFHQANRFMLDHLQKKLGIPEEKMLYHFEQTGNTTSSTIPLVLEHFIANGWIKPGSRILLAGFGVGYSWGGCLLTWP